MNKDNIIKQYKEQIDKKRTEIISTLTAISLLITSGSFIISKDRLKSKERTYQTSKATYNEYYNTTNYHSSYLQEEVDSHYTIIRKVSPWIKDGLEAYRNLTVYRIKGIPFEDLVFKRNYRKVIENLDYEISKEVCYKNELRDSDRYEEPFFEVIEINQNKDDYKETYRPVSKETILALLAELVTYLFLIKMNEAPLTEVIISDIIDINKYKANIKKLKK